MTIVYDKRFLIIAVVIIAVIIVLSIIYFTRTSIPAKNEPPLLPNDESCDDNDPKKTLPAPANVEVVIIAGKDKGRRGNVIRVYDDDRVLVEGVNVARKHQKPNPNAGVPGGIIEKEMPLDISNVMVYNPTADKGDRVGIRFLEDGRKVRYFKSNDEVLDG